MSRRSVVSLISLVVSGATVAAAGAQVIPLGEAFDAAAIAGRPVQSTRCRYLSSTFDMPATGTRASSFCVKACTRCSSIR